MTKTAQIVAVAALILGSSAVAEDNDEGIVLGGEGKPFETSVKMETTYQTNVCNANLGLEYFQKGDAVNVASTITNPDCAASSGSYTVSVRVRDDNGETHNIDFAETWERDDANDVVDEKDYPVGDSVDVLRVKGRRLRCECSVETDDAEAAN
ncbi:MAG: hypothetical protein AAF351_08950 [Pseudomonadota bacterium]